MKGEEKVSGDGLLSTIINYKQTEPETGTNFFTLIMFNNTKIVSKQVSNNIMPVGYSFVFSFIIMGQNTLS